MGGGERGSVQAPFWKSLLAGTPHSCSVSLCPMFLRAHIHVCKHAHKHKRVLAHSPMITTRLIPTALPPLPPSRAAASPHASGDQVAALGGLGLGGGNADVTWWRHAFPSRPVCLCVFWLASCDGQMPTLPRALAAPQMVDPDRRSQRGRAHTHTRFPFDTHSHTLCRPAWASAQGGSSHQSR